jgi:hypothetical protein
MREKVPCADLGERPPIWRVRPFSGRARHRSAISIRTCGANQHQISWREHRCSSCFVTTLYLGPIDLMEDRAPNSPIAPIGQPRCDFPDGSSPGSQWISRAKGSEKPTQYGVSKTCPLSSAQGHLFETPHTVVDLFSYELFIGGPEIADLR